MTWLFNLMNASFYGRLYESEQVKYYGSQELPEIDIPDEVLAILLGIKEGDVPYGDDE